MVASGNTELVALFGGSFDPIHEGHLSFAAKVLETLPVKKLYFVPAWRNPLKGDPGATALQRIQMLRLALNEVGESRFGILDWEALKSEPSYSLHTLEKARQQFGENLVFVAGNEVFESLPRWHQPSRVVSLCHWVIVNRTDGANVDATEVLKQLEINDLKADPLQRGRVIFDQGRRWIQPLEMTKVPVSATALRQNITAAFRHGDLEPIPQGLRRSVWLFIKENHLYAVSD